MSNLKVIGTVREITGLKKGISEKGHEWFRQSIIIDRNKEYNSLLELTLSGEKIINKANELVSIGNIYEFEIDISSKIWNDKYFTNVYFIDAKKLNNEKIKTD